MTRRGALAPWWAVGVLLACLSLHAAWTRPPAVTAAASAGRRPAIRPDYAGVVLPPNIAPLNFTVLEPGRRYWVRIAGPRGKAVEVHSRSPAVVIPPRGWRRLLEANRGGRLELLVCAEDETGRWRRFDPIVQTVANERIDSHLVYRLIRPLHNFWLNTAVYQRNLESHDESLIVHGRAFRDGCVNCHTFLNHRPENMLVHVRGGAGAAMLLGRNGRVSRIETRTKFNPSPAAYVSWHPSGKFVTFSVNKLTQFMHAVGETRDVFDQASDLGCYVLDAKAVQSCRQITRPERLETFPCWSPDGRHLYFCSAPKTPLSQYRQVRYDLMRIAYDARKRQWGRVETVLTSRQTGRSILEPRVSPDGRYLMFCMCDYGNFPVFQPSSDLYLMDLHTGRARRLAVNSDRCESWHCWSSNGRWFVFSSKRRDGVFAKPYFSYFDRDGRAHKPFVLPQKDPEFYESLLKTYTLPELVTGPVELTTRDFARAVLADEAAERAHAVTGATARPGR